MNIYYLNNCLSNTCVVFSRSTGFGVFSGLGRIAAIIGNVTFGQLIDVARAIPVIITATIMILGGFGSLRLPESKDILL